MINRVNMADGPVVGCHSWGIRQTGSGSHENRSSLIVRSRSWPIHPIFAKNYDDWSTWGDYFSVTVDGTDRRPLAMGVRYGDCLVYEREINLGNYDLYSVKTDGSITTVLAAASEEELFRGSLQGWVIFLHVYPTGNHDLYATPADGSGTITGITSGYGEVEFYRE